MSIIPGIENFAPERTLTRSGFDGVAEALAGPPLDLAHRLEDVVPETVRELLAGREVVVAGRGRDREAGRRREARRSSSRRGPRPCRRGGPSSRRRPRPIPRPRRRCSASPRGGRRSVAGGGRGHQGGLLGVRRRASAPVGIASSEPRLYPRPVRGLGCGTVATGPTPDGTNGPVRGVASGRYHPAHDREQPRRPTPPRVIEREHDASTTPASSGASTRPSRSPTSGSASTASRRRSSPAST